MATKLKNLRISKVDFVDEGANPDAHIKLTKSKGEKGQSTGEKCRKKFTKYVRNKQLGIKMPEDTDRIKYQSAIIHKATIAEDREKLWDNKKVWQALESKGFQIMSGLDVIEYTLKAGEKDRIIDAIDTLSGYESNIEEVAKN